MRVFFGAREVTEEEAKALEAEGRAHFSYVDDEGNFILERGPGNKWLETQSPHVFALHIFGHTATWAGMATKWATTSAEGEDVDVVDAMLMSGVAAALVVLNRKLAVAHKNLSRS
ncbi:hypothetical protein SEA_BIGSWOLE_73 [Mycobacterium phage Bigswole]|uniref:Uncharacterized protein n=1 Tax=Mycobacterium phage Bigswole TaxID=2041521 RepID=A0A2D1G7Q7_9CAUD|nr:hypothetical protein KHO58_gp073 [Mycobacterium phage Bigswole]ATN87747.1 hypothetical protein SEA_BIGSWOLE_73 [Mycobacterium phage Bigswole]